MKVRKAVIIAAGRGTRFLPFTKSVPKEMLPLVDAPLLHYSVAEAVASGIEQIIIVTAPGKEAIEHYLAPDEALECFLEDKGDEEHLDQVRGICRMAEVSYVTQEEQLGLGHAVLTAREAVGKEPFAVILPDDIYESKIPAIKQMLAVYDKYQANVVAVESVSREDVSRYGIIKSGDSTGNIHEVLSLVEKPPPEQAPSNLAIVGRYVFLPEIFEMLANTPPGRGGEIQVTDGMQALLKKQKLYAIEIEGIRHDTGNPLGWLKANLALALKDENMGPKLREYIKKLL